jgi:hypothetical protein
MTTVRVRWAGGGEAGIVSLGPDAIVLRSTVPLSPGSRVEGDLVGEAAPAGKLRVKVHSSRRQAEGDYRVEGRPLDLIRELREKLAR